jgi:hypothetical protein
MNTLAIQIFIGTRICRLTKIFLQSMDVDMVAFIKMMEGRGLGLACKAWNLRIPVVKVRRERMKKGVLGQRKA